MSVQNQPPFPQPPSTEGFAAKSLAFGRGIITLATGAKDVAVRGGGALLYGALGKVAAAGAAIYQNTPASSQLAPVASFAAALSLPDSKVLQKRIDHLQNDLMEIADSSVPGELAKATASYTGAYLKHCVTHAATLDPKIAPDWVKEYLLVQSRSDAVASGFLGDTAKAFIKNNLPIVEKLLELNMAKGFCNVFAFIKERQTNDPNWLVRFTAEFFESIAKEIEEKPNGDQMSEEESGERFVKVFSDKIMEIAFPNGADDIELHSRSLSLLKPRLLTIIKQEVLPYALHSLYRDATSNATRDYLVNQAVRYLKNFLETGNIGGLKDATLPEQQGAKAPALKPPEQEAFQEGLIKGSRAMLGALDPDLLQIAEKNNLPGMMKAAAPIMVESIQDLNHLVVANQALKNAMPLMFPGGQETAHSKGHGREFRFDISKPAPFAKTRADLEREKQPQLIEQRRLVHETEGMMKSITNNLSGLFDTIATAIVGKLKEQPETTREKCSNFLKRIAHVFVKAAVRFVFWANYAEVTKSTLRQAHVYARDLSIGKVGAPARRVMTKHIAPGKPDTGSKGT